MEAVGCFMLCRVRIDGRGSGGTMTRGAGLVSLPSKDRLKIQQVG